MRKHFGIIILILAFALIFCQTVAAEDSNSTGNQISVNNDSKIQDAINNASSGDTILVNPGTYNENIVINKTNLTIKANGTVTINAPDVNKPGFSINNLGNNSWIEGFTIRGATSSSGIYLNGVFNSTIYLNRISNSRYGIYLESSINNHILNNTVYENSGYGIFTGSNTPNNIISGNNVTNNGNAGIVINSDNTTVCNNTLNINGNRGSGGWSWDGISINGNNALVYSNTVYDNSRTGLYIHGNNAQILQNSIYNNGGYGINVIGFNVTLNNNSVINNGNAGLVVNGDNSSLSNNTVISNGNRGLGGWSLEGINVSGNNAIITPDNNIHDNGRTGLYIRGNNIILTEFNIYNNGGYGIDIAGQNITITNNTVNNNGNAGIMINSDNSTITNNTITNNGNRGFNGWSWDGIQAIGNNITITPDNIIHDNGRTGLYIRGNNIIITGFNIYNNGAYGIDIAGQNITITNNTVNNNGNAGIIISSDNSTVSENIVTNNGNRGFNGWDWNGISVTGTNTNVSKNSAIGNGGHGISVNGNNAIITPDNIIHDNGRTGLYIRGNNITLTEFNIYNNGGYGIDIAGQNITITNNTINNNSNAGIMINSDNSTITNNTITNNGNRGTNGWSWDGININGKDILAKDNLIYNNGRTGLYVNGNNAQILQNSIYNNGGYGIDSSGLNLTLHDNNLTNNGNAGLMVNGDDSTIINNTVTNNGNRGFNGWSWNGIQATGNNLIITPDNIIHDNGRMGLYVRGNNIIITGFNIYNNGGYGIDIAGLNITVTNNTVNNNSNAGIVINSNYATITNNSATNNGNRGFNGWNWNGIDITGIYSNVSKNNVTGNGGHGISVNGNNAIITPDNIIHDNGRTGLYVRGNNIIITGFNIYNNGGYGIDIAGLNTTVNNNTVNNNSNAGIMINSDYATVSGNTVTNNGNRGTNGWSWDGISITGTNANIFENNVNNNSRTGINVNGNNARIFQNSLIQNGGYGINAAGLNATITNNTVINNGNAGIIINSNYGTITNNTVTNNGNRGFNGWSWNGIDITGNNAIITPDNIIHDNGRMGLYVRGNNIIITGFNIYNNGGYGIDIAGLNITVTNNTVNNNSNAGIMINSDYATVSRNTVTNNGNRGFNGWSWDGISITGNNAIITPDNIIHDNARTGLYVRGNNINLTGFNIYNNGGYGIDIAGLNVTLTNNIATNNSNGGIVINSDYGTITNNTATNNGNRGFNGWSWDGISITGTNTNVSKNSATGNGGHGISVNGNNAQIIQNYSVQNGRYGINIAGLTANVTNNIATNNSNAGIVINSNYGFISGNIVANNGNRGLNGWSWDGISVTGANTIVTGNIVNNNGRTGIAMSSSDSRILKNTAHNNNIGISLNNAQNNILSENSIFGNNIGLASYGSFGNCITDCVMLNNTNYDIYMSGSSANTIHSTFDKSKMYFGDADSYLNNTDDFYVKVIDRNGNPLENATVNVINSDNLFVNLSGITNSDGIFKINDPDWNVTLLNSLNRHRYTLVVSYGAVGQSLESDITQRAPGYFMGPVLITLPVNSSIVPDALNTTLLWIDVTGPDKVRYNSAHYYYVKIYNIGKFDADGVFSTFSVDPNFTILNIQSLNGTIIWDRQTLLNMINTDKAAHPDKWSGITDDYIENNYLNNITVWIPYIGSRNYTELKLLVYSKSETVAPIIASKAVFGQYSAESPITFAQSSSSSFNTHAHTISMNDYTQSIATIGDNPWEPQNLIKDSLIGAAMSGSPWSVVYSAGSTIWNVLDWQRGMNDLINGQRGGVMGDIAAMRNALFTPDGISDTDFMNQMCDELGLPRNTPWDVVIQKWKEKWGVGPGFQKGKEWQRGHSYDPNEKVGPDGYGFEGFIPQINDISYIVFFENQKNATFAAQKVVITDYLDNNLDWSSFKFGEIHIGNNITIPAGDGVVELKINDTLTLRVTRSIDLATGLVTWTFESIDPETGLPPEDASIGFLPPNINSPEGEGHVIFSVNLKSGLQSGTAIRNKATIIFDENSPMNTNEVLNTIDSQKPTSNVNPLPIQNLPDFEVSWIGNDNNGSGIKNYVIYVSENDGSYQKWLETADTSAIFHGIAGNVYKFFSVATDNVGNIENTPIVADAVTNVLNITSILNNRTGLTYNTIQAAIDDLNTTNGDSLIIPNGTYTENVVLNKSLILTALGIVNVKALNTALPVFTITSSGSGSIIQGFVISGSSNSGIYIDNSTGNTIINNTIDGQLESSKAYWGICIVNSAGNNTILNNTVKNSEEGINLYNVNGATIKGNTITNNHWDNLALNLSNFNIITENVITNADSGIRLIESSNNNIILNNNLNGNIWSSISLVGGQLNQIINNTASGNQEGIYLYASNNNTLSGNTANNNTWDGIAIHDSNNNTVQNNINITSNNSGIRIVGTSSENQINNNTINGNLWSNISLDTAMNNTISDNTLTNALVGIYMQGASYNQIRNNTIENNSWDGIDILSGSNNNSIQNNTITGSYYGERIVDSVNNISYGNNYINNTIQAYDNGSNQWDNGVDSGNYWNDWTTTDPRTINGGISIDNYPELNPF